MISVKAPLRGNCRKYTLLSTESAYTELWNCMGWLAVGSLKVCWFHTFNKGGTEDTVKSLRVKGHHCHIFSYSTALKFRSVHTVAFKSCLSHYLTPNDWKTPGIPLDGFSNSHLHDFRTLELPHLVKPRLPPLLRGVFSRLHLLYGFRSGLECGWWLARVRDRDSCRHIDLPTWRTNCHIQLASVVYKGETPKKIPDQYIFHPTY